MFLLLGLALVLAAPAPAIDPSQYQALRYRLLGPSRGGRSTAVTGIPGRPHTFFAGSSGGLWKTDDAGMTWRSVSDGFFESGSIGAVAVADADPNVVYAGTGRRASGATSRPASGLPVDRRRPDLDALRPSRRRPDRTDPVHPRDQDLLYVAARQIFGPKPRAGRFRSNDGGKSWEKVLFDQRADRGRDLAMDAENPRILYAAMWTASASPGSHERQRRERPLQIVRRRRHLDRLRRRAARGRRGKIAVAVSPADADRVWALVEAGGTGGLYRSDDAGTTWRHLGPARAAASTSAPGTTTHLRGSRSANTAT